MPIILKETENTKGKKVSLDPNNVKKLEQKVLKFDDIWKKNDGVRKDIPGVQQAKHVIGTDYNTDKDHKKSGEITMGNAKRIINHAKYDKNGKSVFNQLFDGDVMTDIKSKVRQIRTQQKPTLPQKDNNKTATQISNPSVQQVKPVKANSTLSESYSQGTKSFGDFLSEYDEWSVFSMFQSNEKPFTNLINPTMYQKALSEFVKFGKFINFPTKYIYQWMGIIMTNTSIISSITNIAGHSSYSPIDSFIDFYFNDDADEWQEYKNQIEEDGDYEAMCTFLDEKGFWNWAVLPDGSDAYSDYGLEPLCDICWEYDENKSPEEIIVLVNKALDITHCRGDLASAFITGGAQTLSQISESKSSTKIVHLNESQLRLIKEYRDQMVLPFDGDNQKLNYEHFVDWLEDVGQYGKLEKSNAQIQTLIQNNMQEAFDTFKNTEYDIEDCFDDFIYELKQNQENIYDLLETDNIDEETVEEILNSYYGFWDLYDYLNDFGQSEFEAYQWDRFETQVQNAAYDFKIDERGLIFVERAIQIPNIMDKNFSYLNTKKQDLYQHLTYQFDDHIGQFWSWCEGGVQCPYGYTSKTNTIFLRGYVDPQSVDWVDTLYKQCYSLQDEKEIFVTYNEPIEITEITYQGKRFPLRNSIIVKA